MLKGVVYAEYYWQAQPVRSNYVFCPHCASRLEQQPVGGLERPVCPRCGPLPELAFEPDGAAIAQLHLKGDFGLDLRAF